LSWRVPKPLWLELDFGECARGSASKIAWPLFAEQNMNAVMLVDSLKVG